MHQLLQDDEPVAGARAARGTAGRTFLLTADHAGRAIPRSLGRLGLPESELERPHRLGHRHRRRHRAPVGGAGCHRRAADLFAPGDRLQSRSDGAELDPRDQRGDRRSPAISACRPSSARRGVEAIFEPYHARIRGPAGCAPGGRRGAPCYVAMHSFTPVFKGESRGDAGRRAVQPRRPAGEDHAGTAARRGRSDGRRQRALRGQRRHRLRRAGARASGAACRTSRSRSART